MTSRWWSMISALPWSYLTSTMMGPPWGGPVKEKVAKEVLPETLCSVMEPVPLMTFHSKWQLVLAG
jgi:hypothetical protein